YAKDVRGDQTMWFHQLGEPADKDVYILGKQFPRIAEIGVRTSRDGRFVVARVKNGDGGEEAYWVTGPDPGPRAKWVPVSAFAAQVVGADIGSDGTLFLLSRRDAPMGKVLATPATAPSLAAAKVVVPPTDRAISDFRAVGATLVVREMVGGPSQL